MISLFQRLFAGGVAVFLVACGSVPPKPFAIDQFERAMARGSERFQAGELPAALAGFQQAMRSAELNDSIERRSSALLSIGAIHFLLEENELASSAYAECLREAQNTGDKRTAVLSQLGLSNIARANGDNPASLAQFNQILAQADVLDPGERMQAEIGRALALAGNGQTIDSLNVLERLEKQARTQSLTVLSAVLSNQSAVLLLSKQPERALPYAREALVLDRTHHHPPSIASSHMRLAEVYAALGRLSEARDAAERAERIYLYTGQRKTLTRLQAMRKSWQ